MKANVLVLGSDGTIVEHFCERHSVGAAGELSLSRQGGELVAVYAPGTWRRLQALLQSGSTPVPPSK